MAGALLRPRVPMVVTVHDLVQQKRPGEHLRAGLRGGMRHLALARATRLIVPTHAVAADAAEHLRVDPERIDVIAEAPATAFTPRSADEVAAARVRHGIPEDYLLWVGHLGHPDPHRRVNALVEAPRELPLVLVGAAGQWARELPGVILTGEVDDDELAALYTGAHALVLPSEEEGFGLPAVEALACGTPVVAADGPSLREVLDGRATFVEAGDVDGLVAAAHSAQRPAPAPPAGPGTTPPPRPGTSTRRRSAPLEGGAGAGAPEVGPGEPVRGQQGPGSERARRRPATPAAARAPAPRRG